MRYPLTNNHSFICHPFLPSHHFQYKEIQNTTRQIDRSISQTFFREDYSFVNVVSTWKCVLRMFTLASKAHCIKDTEHDMFHILDTNDTVEEIQVACDRFKSTFPSFELHKGRLLRDLFNSIRTKSSLTLHKLELLKCMLQGFENAAVEEAIYHSMNCCDKIEEATLLLVIFNSILITPNNHVLPPITTLHNLYKESHVDPNDAILSFKRKMYREEINRIIDIQIKNHCRINARWQGESSVLGSEKRGDDLIHGSMSHSNTPLHVSAEGENPSSFAVDVNKLSIFLDEVIRSEPPNSGWDLLLLDKTECYKFYRDALDKKLAFIRDESVSSHENSFKKQEGTPKLTMLASSRQHQLQHVCQCVMMWETKQIDNIQRMNDLLTLGSNINYRSVLPLQKANEDVVQSLCRDVYIDPDDNPDYDPPDSNVSGKMMRQMIHSKCENKRSFVPTDLETRKDELEKLAKDFEPYDHLTPEELSDVFLKNTKKEYELAVATYKRRIRNRSVEDYEEKRELEAGIRDLEVEEVAKRKRPDGNMVSDVYNKTRGECLTELLYFISLLEHLQWHFFASVNLPMESLVDVKEIGYSPTNPRVPGIKFGDPLCAEGSIHSKYFLSERGGASIVRKCLTVGGLHNTKADAKQGNQLLLFGDDPLFFVKDQEMLQHMLQCGIGLEIHSKVPGFVLPSEPTEFQKDTSYYRLSTTQPQCLIICSKTEKNLMEGNMTFWHQMMMPSVQVVTGLSI